MAEIVDMIMQDIGMTGVLPGTFPELLTWAARSAIGIVLIAGVFKTIFWFISMLDSERKVKF